MGNRSLPPMPRPYAGNWSFPPDDLRSEQRRCLPGYICPKEAGLNISSGLREARHFARVGGWADPTVSSTSALCLHAGRFEPCDNVACSPGHKCSHSVCPHAGMFEAAPCPENAQADNLQAGVRCVCQVGYYGWALSDSGAVVPVRALSDNETLRLRCDPCPEGVLCIQADVQFGCVRMLSIVVCCSGYCWDSLRFSWMHRRMAAARQPARCQNACVA